MARLKKNTKVGEVVDAVSSVTIDLMYNPNPGKHTHAAMIDDVSLEDVDINVLRKKVVAALVERRSLVWYPVISVAFREGLKFELARCQLTKRPDGFWLSAEWDDLHSTKRAFVPKDYEIGQRVRQWSGRQYYLHYDETVWTKLSMIQERLQQLETTLITMLDGGAEAILGGSFWNSIEDLP